MTKHFPAIQHLAGFALSIDASASRNAGGSVMEDHFQLLEGDTATMAAEAIQEVLYIVGELLHDVSPSERQTKLKGLVDVALLAIRHSNPIDTVAIGAVFDSFFLEV